MGWVVECDGASARSGRGWPEDQRGDGWAEVEVSWRDGSVELLRVFSLVHIAEVMQRNSRTGGFFWGEYFCAEGLVVVREVSEAGIVGMVRELMGGEGGISHGVIRPEKFFARAAEGVRMWSPDSVPVFPGADAVMDLHVEVEGKGWVTTLYAVEFLRRRLEEEWCWRDPSMMVMRELTEESIVGSVLDVVREGRLPEAMEEKCE